MSAAIDIDWLDRAPQSTGAGLTASVPWARGDMVRPGPIALRDARGPVPTQSWPLGYWPDGSVKWSALAIAPGRALEGPLAVVRQPSPPPAQPLRVSESAAAVEIDVGAFRCTVPKRGPVCLCDLEADGACRCEAVRLVAVRERRSAGETTRLAERTEFTGMVDAVTVEQRGPIRAVLKLTGRHICTAGGESFLPFSLRLFFYTGSPSVGLVHTFIYDGDGVRDHIAGLGVHADLPMRAGLHQRRVWFPVADGGVFCDAVRGVPPHKLRSEWRDGLDINPERRRHVAGENIEEPGGTAFMPVWDQFRLLQESPDHFSIGKRCGEDSCWVTAQHGCRAPGTMAVSDGDAGFGISMRDFWQAWPSALEVRGATSAHAQVRAWLWPPEAQPADLRHYADRMHGPVYECASCCDWGDGPVQPRFSNAHGIARTSELTLHVLPPGFDRETLAGLAADGAEPPRLVCAPAHYRASEVFGRWSLPSAGGAKHRLVEDRLTALLDHYLAEVERNRWYGFWDYGDVMHSFDPDRHCWRYDEGGYAWANTECMPDLWLWYSFLRSGRPDVFRMAEAMTRHTRDVDIYHLGPFAGLGTRHNVTHWGCFAKEIRISMAGNRRFHYFLTADERSGDVLAETLDRWPAGPTVLPTAPGWANLCWNWLTAWERSGDDVYRRRLQAGVDSILAVEPPLVAGPMFRLDPETGEMTFESADYSYHMMLPFGAPEVWFEMVALLGSDAWSEALAGLGELWAMAPEARRTRVPNDQASRADWETAVFSARLIAWAAVRRDSPDLARRAWEILLADNLVFATNRNPNTGTLQRELLARTRDVSHTNLAAQWSLNAIQCLELIGDALEG